MQRRHFLRSVSSLSAAAALVPAHTWAQGAKPALTPVKFTLDFKVTSQTAPFFLAAAKGYYAQEGLDVQIDVGAGSVASLTRVASGAYDLGLGDISALIEAHAKGSLPVQAVYQYYNRAPFVIIGRKDRGITTQMASLKGKKVAEQQQLGSDFFEWVTTDFSARDNVMVRGDVDAATYFHDSAVSLFQRMPPEQLSVLSYAEAGVHLYGNAIVASTALMKDKPELVRGFLRATQRALLDALANPSEALAAVRAREPMLRDDQERARWAITRTYLANAETAQVGLGRIQTAVLQQQIAQIGKTFGLPQLPTVQAVWNTGFLPTAVQQGAGA